MFNLNKIVFHESKTTLSSSIGIFYNYFIINFSFEEEDVLSTRKYVLISHGAINSVTYNGNGAIYIDT